MWEALSLEYSARLSRSFCRRHAVAKNGLAPGTRPDQGEAGVQGRSRKAIGALFHLDFPHGLAAERVVETPSRQGHHA